MIKSIRPQYRLLLLFTVTLAVYCSSLIEITLKPNSVGIDDHGLLQYLLNHRLTFHDLFFVHNSGKYFRPFLGLTYLIDQRLWGEMVFGYRLINVLLHACNALFAYLIGRLLLQSEPDREAISLASSVLFAVHPLAVESVAWISGRTDLLATFFALIAVYLYLSAHDKNAFYMLPASLVCTMASFFSKETGIIPIILIMAWDLYYRKHFIFPKLKFAPIFTLLLVSAGIFYFVMRYHALSARDMSMEIIKAHIFSIDFSAINLFFASYGFYFKKFLIPFPMQFAIDSINVFIYRFFGSVVISLFAVTAFFPRLVRYHFLYFWALIGLLPAAIVSFTDIAWTSWAERYLYFSLVPLSFAGGTFFVKIANSGLVFARRISLFFAVVVVIIFAATSVQRSHIWNNDLALAGDTFEKAPLFVPASVAYARSLEKTGRREEAEKQLHQAEFLPGPKHQVFYNLGLISMRKGNYTIAEEYLLHALSDAREDRKLRLMGPYVKKTIYMSLSNLKIKQSSLYTDTRAKDRYYKKAAGYLVDAYREEPTDSFLLYNIGKLYLLMKNKAEARKYFEEFIKKSNDDIYRQTAEKLLQKIADSV